MHFTILIMLLEVQCATVSTYPTVSPTVNSTSTRSKSKKSRSRSANISFETISTRGRISSSKTTPSLRPSSTSQSRSRQGRFWFTGFNSQVIMCMKMCVINSPLLSVSLSVCKDLTWRTYEALIKRFHLSIPQTKPSFDIFGLVYNFGIDGDVAWNIAATLMFGLMYNTHEQVSEAFGADQRLDDSQKIFWFRPCWN